MLKLIIRWLLYATALLAVTYVYSGVQVSSFGVAMFAAFVIGLLNTLVRPILVVLTLPVTLLTLGLFLFVINALMFWAAAEMLSGFHVTGFVAALVGSLMYSVLGEIDDAVLWLRRTADEGFPCFPWFQTDPFLSNLRKSEAGAALMRELERALAQQEQLGVEPIDRADVRFQLVQALWATDRRDEARAQLAVVDQELAPLGARADHRRRPIRAWILAQGVGYVL